MSNPGLFGGFGAPVVPASNTAGTPNAPVSSRTTTTSTTGYVPLPPTNSGLFAGFGVTIVPPSSTAGVPIAPVSGGTTTPSTQPKSTVPAVRAVSTPNKALSTALYRESVTLVVGTSKIQYTLHKGLLCFYSDFFRAAFNGSFKEANERRIDLPEVEIDVFEAFQVWLYTQCLPQNENAPAKTYPEWALLIKIWIFGDNHQIPLLQNSVIDAIIDKVDKDTTIPTFSINLAYENTLPSSPLRKTITDIMTYRSKLPDGTPGNAETHVLLCPDQWPREACLDVMAEMSRGWRQKVVRGHLPRRERCYYHVHGKDEHC